MLKITKEMPKDEKSRKKELTKGEESSKINKSPDERESRKNGFKKNLKKFQKRLDKQKSV